MTSHMTLIQDQELDLIVFWGSQGGRAEKLAGNFARECCALYGLQAVAADLDDYDHEHLVEVPSSKLLVFIISTFGEGDPTDNSARFCTTLTNLRKDSGTQSLRELRYAACGLGNRNYKHFNKMVDITDETFTQLGAKRIGPVARADEAQGSMSTEDNFMEWKEAVLQSVAEKFNVTERTLTYAPEVDIVTLTGIQSTSHLEGLEAQYHASAEDGKGRSGTNGTFVARMAVSRSLTSTPDRSCLHLEFNLPSDRALKYQSGDHLVVLPINPEEEVQRLCNLLGLSELTRAEAIEIKSRVESKPLSIPRQTTRESILRHDLDICGPVSRDLLRLLRTYSPTAEAAEIIGSLANDRDRFASVVSSRRLSLGKVLQLAGGSQPWVRLPFTLLVESSGKLQPRYYSIASSPTISPHQPAITVSVTSKVMDASNPEVRFNGVASNFLSAVAQNRRKNDETVVRNDDHNVQHNGPEYQKTHGKVLAHLRRSMFKLPPNPQRPIVMIGAGTGVAPFRAFVQERVAMADYGLSVGPMLLLFGCRSPVEDFLYADEWKEYQARCPQLEVLPAFSRWGERIYVQDRLLELKDRVALLLERNAVFYICGSADMARCVRNALVKILMSWRGWEEMEAERYIMNEMRRTRTLQEDIWSA